MLSLLLAPSVAFAQSPPPAQCGDVKQLYALRSLTMAQWRPLLHLAPLAQTGNLPGRGPFWDVSLTRVWPAQGASCDQAVVLVEQMGYGDRGGPLVSVSRVVLVTVPPGSAAGAYNVQDLPPTDWRFLADPRVPDLDGDGIPEHWVIREGPFLDLQSPTSRHESDSGAAPELCDLRTTGNGCLNCDIPGGTMLTLTGSRGGVLAGPVFFGGRAPDTTLDARARTALRRWHEADAGQGAGQGPTNADGQSTCPQPVPHYATFQPVGDPFVRATTTGGPATLEWRGTPGQCTGWNEGVCQHAHAVVRTVSVNPGPATANDTQIAASATVAVGTGCRDCELHAVQWSLPDSVRTPHVIPVDLTPSELRHARHRAAADGHGLALSPGVWAVQVSGPATAPATYQVVIAPGDRDPVQLPP